MMGILCPPVVSTTICLLLLLLCLLAGAGQETCLSLFVVPIIVSNVECGSTQCWNAISPVV